MYERTSTFVSSFSTILASGLAGSTGVSPGVEVTFVPTSIILSTASTLLVETTFRSVSLPSTRTTCSTVVMRPSFPSWTTFSLPFSRSALSRRIVLYERTSTFVSSFSTILASGLDGTTGVSPGLLDSFVPTSIILSIASTLVIETSLRSTSLPSARTTCSTVVMRPSFPSCTTFSVPFSRVGFSWRIVLYASTSTLVSSFSTILTSGLDGTTGVSPGLLDSFVPTSIILSTASTLLVETTLRSTSLPSTRTTRSTVVTIPSFPSWTTFSVPFSRLALSRRMVLYERISTLVSFFSTILVSGLDGSTGVSLGLLDSFVPTSIILSTASTLLDTITLRSFSTPSTRTTCSIVVIIPSFPSWTTFSVPLARLALSRRIVLNGRISTFVSSFSTTLGSGLDGSTGAAGSFVPTSMILSTASTLSVETTLRSFSTPSTMTIFTTVVMRPAFPSWTTFSVPFSRSALSRRTVL